MRRVVPTGTCAQIRSNGPAAPAAACVVRQVSTSACTTTTRACHRRLIRLSLAIGWGHERHAVGRVARAEVVIVMECGVECV